jgi:hypothetical protein
MPITFDNDFTKQWLAHRGPAKVFGKDVDTRERLSDPEAVAWFDRIWESNLRRAVEQASPCDIDFVRAKVPHFAQNFIDESAGHREFTFANCLFICQLPDPQTCNQLWFIPSTSGDPRTLYVKFKTVPIKEAFDRLAGKLGWKPDELGEKILLDFMETVTREAFRADPRDADKARQPE